MARYTAPPTPSGCMIWLRQIDRDGYGRVWLNGKKRGAHVVAWELTNGPIPKGLEPDHLCKIPYCVNPHHLELVTTRVNQLRGWGGRPKKFFCDKCGSPYEVLRTRPTGKVERGCRACKNQRWRERQHERRTN